MTMVDDAWRGKALLAVVGAELLTTLVFTGVLTRSELFSKAFGVVGGIVVMGSGDRRLPATEGPPFLFSSAVIRADSAACLAAVRVLAESTDLVDRLWQNTRMFKSAMHALGFDIGNSDPDHSGDAR